jgi:two-component sensor histidine kinase
MDYVNLKIEETEVLNNIKKDLNAAKVSLADLTIQFEIQRVQMTQRVIELDRKFMDRVTEMARIHGMVEQERWQLDLDCTVFTPAKGVEK